MWKRYLLVIGLSVAFLLSTGSTAFAQSDDETVDLADQFTTATCATTWVASVILVGMALWGLANLSWGQLEVYIRDNAVGLQQDLYLGGGESVQDLAAMFRVPQEQRAEFADILYEHREQLAELAEPGEVDETSARQFGEIVVDEMIEDGVIGSPQDLYAIEGPLESPSQ